MYRWYRNADVCYAYLADVDSHEDPGGADSSFRKSAWFTRGWTLQELLAPRVIYFYDANWREIGSRESLVSIITNITSIPSEYFETGDLARYSIAQRMSWASQRSTTRIEDETYCLLGIFGINMPLLYGEGKAAFRRLQEELLRRSDDLSILAFSRRDNTVSNSVLADSPTAFELSGGVKKSLLTFFPSMPGDIRITNRGIELTLNLIEHESRDRVAAFALLPLEENGRIVVIPLVKGKNGPYHRRQGRYELVAQERARDSVSKAITLVHGQLEVQNTWFKVSNADEGLIVRYPAIEVSGFYRAWFKLFRLESVGDIPGEHYLVHHRGNVAFGNIALMCFMSAEGGMFALRIETDLKTLTVTLWTDLEDSEADVLRASRTARSSRAGLAGDRIKALQRKGTQAVIEVISRRGPGRWIIHLSISPSSK